MALIIQFKDAHWLIVINKIQPLAIDKKHTLVAKMTHNKEKTKQIETEKKTNGDWKWKGGNDMEASVQKQSKIVTFLPQKIS